MKPITILAALVVLIFIRLSNVPDNTREQVISNPCGRFIPAENTTPTNAIGEITPAASAHPWVSNAGCREVYPSPKNMPAGKQLADLCIVL